MYYLIMQGYMYIERYKYILMKAEVFYIKPRNQVPAKNKTKKKILNYLLVGRRMCMDAIALKLPFRSILEFPNNSLHCYY